MNARIEPTARVIQSAPRPAVWSAPSLRVPVTPGNRTRLRALRAAELAAWEAGRACTLTVFPLSPAAATVLEF